MTFSRKGLKNILFLDIETVPAHSDYEAVDETLKFFWRRKAKYILRQDEDALENSVVAQAYSEKAGIYAEFAKVVCISVGFFTVAGDEVTRFRLKSFYGDDERKLLSDFDALIRSHFYEPTRHAFCGHNIREFDLPFLCRRFLIQQIDLPNMLRLSAKRPWQINHVLDTMEHWKFGDYKHYTSLGLLTALLGIPSPKDEMDGSMVGRAYWIEQDLESIVRYCEKDVVSVARLFLKLQGADSFADDIVESVTAFGQESG